MDVSDDVAMDHDRAFEPNTGVVDGGLCSHSAAEAAAYPGVKDSGTNFDPRSPWANHHGRTDRGDVS